MTVRTGVLFAVLVGMMAGSRTEAGSLTDQQIVDRFFPAAMKRGVHRDHMHAKWSRASLHGGPGEESIVAVYTNGKLAAVRVIGAVEGEAPRVVSTFESREMTGLAARLELLDLDNDGVPEIAAQLAAAGGNSRTWLFRWSDGALRMFGPTIPGHRASRVTLLGDPLFVDIDGDGFRDAINFPDDHMASGNPADVYLLRDGSFVPAGFEVVVYDVFVERNQPGEIEEISFQLHDVTGTYALSLVNGDEHGANTVTSADVTVNGEQVPMRKHGSDSRSSTSAPMRLASSNVATVTLRGAPGSHVSLFVHRPTAEKVRDAKRGAR